MGLCLTILKTIKFVAGLVIGLAEYDDDLMT